MHAKQETEPIFTTLDRYRAELLEHPLLVAARTGQIERTTRITWIPMLAQMKEKALKSRRLRKAIEDNIAHEAGLGSTSHVTLAAQLMRSLGVRGLDELPTEGIVRTASIWLSDAFHARWMAEAVDEVVALYGPECVPQVLEGMADAWAETCEDPIELWGSR